MMTFLTGGTSRMSIFGDGTNTILAHSGAGNFGIR